MYPTTIFYNGDLYTQWPDCPRAQAVACYGGRIVAVGADDEVRALAGPGTQQVDLGGRFGLPGLTDAHFHFYNWAIARSEVHLAGARSLGEMQARIRARLGGLAAGRWLVGQGWNETEWQPATMPHADDLDALSMEHPMAFWRSDMHGVVVNRAALAQAGITRETPDPAGGVIERDERGEPTGRLFELAIGLIRRHIPDPTEEEALAAVREAIGAAHRLGLVGVHDQRMKGHGEGGPALRAYGRLHAEGALTLRIASNVDSAERKRIFKLGLYSGLGDERLHLGHMKIFVDGSLGSQTAWMVEPFEGTTDNFGVVVTPVEEIQEIVREAQRHRWAISVHAIGDRANREMLDIFEELAAERDPTMTVPHRIEHVQTIQPADLPRLARLGITASVQPIHATDDWVAAERLWGERGRNAYPFRRLLDSGATLALGSDCPVADPNPFAGIHAAVTRQRPDGTPPGGWYPAERLTVAEAIAGYTLGPARAQGRDSFQGRLAPGYLADLTLLDRNLFATAPEQLAETKAEMVVVGGVVVMGE